MYLSVMESDAPAPKTYRVELISDQRGFVALAAIIVFPPVPAQLYMSCGIYLHGRDRVES